MSTKRKKPNRLISRGYGPTMPNLAQTVDTLNAKGIDFKVTKIGDEDKHKTIEVQGIRIYFTNLGDYHSSETI